MMNMIIESALVKKLNELPPSLQSELLYDLIWFLYCRDYILYSNENNTFYWECDGEDVL